MLTTPQKKDTAAHLARMTQKAIAETQRNVRKLFEDARTADCLDEYKLALRGLGCLDDAKPLIASPLMRE